LQPNGIFITGTDTGVGKTLVCAGLVRLARMWGLRAVGLKPIETGCPVRDGELFPEDGHFLWLAGEKQLSLDECTPFRFAFPAAPCRASSVVGSRLSPREIVGHIREVSDHADLTLVEGAGGLMVPINEKSLMIDLMSDLGYPVLLIARSRLGTLNHTLLSLGALQQRDIRILGIIVSFSESVGGPEEEFVASDLKRFSGEIPVWSLPYLQKELREDPVKLAESLAQAVPQDTLERWFGTGRPRESAK
jgi:dethiobiotin synthetase